MVRERAKKYYVLEDRIKIKKKYITKNIRYLGTAEKILKDLQELDHFRKESKKA
jgi:hypothetical protein